MTLQSHMLRMCLEASLVPLNTCASPIVVGQLRRKRWGNQCVPKAKCLSEHRIIINIMTSLGPQRESWGECQQGSLVRQTLWVWFLPCCKENGNCAFWKTQGHPSCCCGLEWMQSSHTRDQRSKKAAHGNLPTLWENRRNKLWCQEWRTKAEWEDRM